MQVLWDGNRKVRPDASDLYKILGRSNASDHYEITKLDASDHNKIRWLDTSDHYEISWLDASE